MICKCEDKGDKIFKNSSINQTAIGSVGFDSEITYDSFASHTSMDISLKDELQLTDKYIGDLKIQTYGGVIREKDFKQ